MYVISERLEKGVVSVEDIRELWMYEKWNFQKKSYHEAQPHLYIKKSSLVVFVPWQTSGD